MNDGTTSGATSEPELTLRNSATVQGEEHLAGTTPAAYGSHGGTAPQADEGSGETGEDDLATEGEDSLQTEGLQPG